MWIMIIIIAVIVFVAISFISSQQHNKEIKNHHISQGGLRQSFPIFTSHLQNSHKMNLVIDTGRMFSYAKQLREENNTFGTLTIGIKYDMTNQLIMFSKYINPNNVEFQGMNVSVVNFDKIENIDRYINISLDKIKDQGVLRKGEPQSDSVDSVEHNGQSLASEWLKINEANNKLGTFNTIDTYIDLFFIPDSIIPVKFFENLDILENYKTVIDEDYGTKTARQLTFIAPAFYLMFVSAYPDVYQWYQDNIDNNTIEIRNKLLKKGESVFTSYLTDPDKRIIFYRALVDQFISEGRMLECSQSL